MLRHGPLLQSEPTDLSSPQTENGGWRRRGATAMEYLFMLSLIAVLMMSGVNYFGQQTKKVADDASTAIQNATKPKNQSGK